MPPEGVWGMREFKGFVRKRWLAALGLLLAMGLSASGGAMLALEAEAARRALEAEDLVAQADALLAVGDVAHAGYTYLWVLDNYRYTPAKHDAHAALLEMKARVRGGEIDLGSFWAFVDVLPSFWDLNTLEAMNAAANMEHVYAGELGKLGMAEEAREMWAETLENTLESLRVYWRDPASYSTPRTAIAVAKRLGGPEEEATIENLEEFVEWAGPCMGSYGVRAALAEYYSHQGRSGPRRRHIQPLVDEGAAGYVVSALESPHVDSLQKVAMRHTHGLALMVAGNWNPEYLPLALAAYEEIDADPAADGTDFKEWAAFNIARVIQNMNPDDPQAGIAAYEDYLAQRLPPEPGETEWRERKYPNLARFELARIYLGLGEYDTAAAYAEQALLDQKYPWIVDLAEDCLRRIFEAQSQE